MVLSALLATVWVVLQPPLFTTSMRLFVESGYLKGEPIDGQIRALSPEVRKVLHFSTSTAVLDHVIGELDLITHYRLDPEATMAKVSARNRLMDRMDVSMMDRSLIVIRVRDRDRMMAVRIAQVIQKRLIGVVEGDMRGQLRRSALVQERVYKGLQRQAEDLEASVQALLDSSRSALKSEDLWGPFALKYQRMLDQMAHTQMELASVLQVRRINAGLSSKEEQVPIKVVQRPEPDLSTSVIRAGIVRVVSLALISTLMLMFLMAAWLKGGDALLSTLKDLDALGPGNRNPSGNGQLAERSQMATELQAIEP
ncbi:MAG: hypothetical protein KDB88_00805 [Flavobacteriales bacterium]|nr:hypothetical protein [Flavobacteriales bacterium]